MNNQNAMPASQDVTVDQSKSSNPKISLMSNEMARYLTSSLILDGAVRKKIINLVQEKRKAMAPELGIDIGQLIKMTYLLENREKRYQNIFAAISIVAIILSIFLLGSGYEMGLLIICWLVLAIFYYRHDSYKRNELLDPVKSKSNFDITGFEQTLESKYTADIPTRSIPDSDQNMVVYEDFIPFVGAGINIGGWSFPINVSRPQEDLGHTKEIQPFTLPELYSAIENMIYNCNFDHFLSHDFLFISGNQVREFEWILPKIAESPLTHVDTHYIDNYQAENDPAIRYYAWMRIHDQKNDLVLSYFLRFSIRGEYLFVEINRFLLLPLDEKYQQIDHLHEPITFGEEVGTFARRIISSLLATPFVAIGSIFASTGRLFSAISNKGLLGNPDRKMENKMKKDSTFNYGASSSLREDLSSQNYSHYFQKLDREMYVQVFEKQLIEAMVSFLSDHNIDTSDIQDRKSTILNTGIIMKGGELKTESLAVGSQAQSSVTQRMSQQIRKVSGTSIE